MTTPQERIAAGQELRRRGRLSPEQDRALAELERRYGGSQAAPVGVGTRGGMVERGEMTREEYMRTRYGVGFNGQPLAPRDYGTAPSGPDGRLIPMATQTGERTLGMGSGLTKGDIERFDPASLERPQDVGAAPRMSRAQSAALGVTSLNPVARNLLPSEGFEEAMTQSLQDNPVTTRFGQGAAITAGGGLQLTGKAIAFAPRLVSPAVAARFAGTTASARAGRYLGRGAVLSGVGVVDYGAYNILAESQNQQRLTGRPVDRLGFAAGEVFTPGGAVAAAGGPALSLLYRAGRGAVTGIRNSVTASIAAGRPTAAAGVFTPRDVQQRVAASTIDPNTGRTAREEAYDLLLKKGFNPDEAEKAVKLISYDNYSTVDEMLFELANADINQLAVALGRVGGDAQKILRDAFEARNISMPDRIRVALRDAMGLSGEELEDFALQLSRRANEATADGYQSAYSASVSDETWSKIWDRLRVSPDAESAITFGARLARNSYAGDPAKLEVARQLDELAGALASPDALPPKLSTHALDYLDRGFGSLIAGAKTTNRDYARSLLEIRNAIRTSGLDAETGLNKPRELYSQFMAASRALDFGQKAAGRTTPLRDLKKQFAASLRESDEVFEDIVGEGRSIVDQALVMGWLRGAEDAIETATNPGALIRQIYGSERQRAKLLEMMPDPAEGMSSGLKADLTKNIKALVGSQGKNDYNFDFALSSGARAEGRTAVPSLFERQRQMLGSQSRVTGGSQTSNTTEAIAAQGGLQRMAEGLTRAVMNPEQAAKNAVLWAVQRVTTPAIYKPAVNRELGQILATRGREDLLRIIGEIRQRQAAQSVQRGPGRPGSGSGRAGRQDLARDATIGAAAAGVAGSASADQPDFSMQMDASNRRVEAAERRVLEIENNAIPRLEEDLRLLENPDSDPRQIQTLLANRGFDLGERGIDGVIGPATRRAIAENVRAIKGEITFQRSELEKARQEEADARAGLKQVEMQAAQAQAGGNVFGQIFSKAAPFVGAAAGLALGYATRGAAVRNSGIIAQEAADKANAFLNPRPVSRAATGDNSLNARAANINEFWRMGGAGENVPFRTIRTGEWRQRPGAAEPSELFNARPPRFTSTDIGVMGAGLAEAGFANMGANAAREWVAESKAEVDKYAAEGDLAGVQRALQKQQQAEFALSAAIFMERAGVAIAAGRFVGGLKNPYATVRPDVASAERERALLLSAIEKSRN